MVALSILPGSAAPQRGEPDRYHQEMIRLRQVALVAHDLNAVVDDLCESLGLSVCFNDPGVGEFGLVNALMVVGDQFIEVVSPNTEGTTAGRLLERRGGDGGYMVLFEVNDLDGRIDHAERRGVRIVWRGDFDDIRGRHLHPRDIGGAIVSLDEAIPRGAWRWGGPNWAAHEQTSVASAIAGISISADQPDEMRRRWTEIRIDQSVRFTLAGPRGEGLDEVDLVASDRTRVGETFDIGGVRWTLV